MNQLGNHGKAIPVYYTAKTINATESSRTAILQDLEVGDVVVLDNDSWDGEQQGAERWDNVTLATASADLENPAFVVVGVSHGVNKLVTGSTTQRQGGKIDVVPVHYGGIPTRITGTCNRGDNLIIALHSTAGTGGCLEAATAIANITNIKSFKGHMLQTSAGTSRRLGKVAFGTI